MRLQPTHLWPQCTIIRLNPADRHPSALFPIVLARHRDGPALDKARVLAVKAEHQLPAELRTLKSFEADRDRNPGETHLIISNAAIYGTRAVRDTFAALNLGLRGVAKTLSDLPLVPPHARGGSRETQTRPDTSVQNCYGSSGAGLSLSAIRLGAGSERALSFCIRRLRCSFTVASAMPISPPARK